MFRSTWGFDGNGFETPLSNVVARVTLHVFHNLLEGARLGDAIDSDVFADSAEDRFEHPVVAAVEKVVGILCLRQELSPR